MRGRTQGPTPENTRQHMCQIGDNGDEEMGLDDVIAAETSLSDVDGLAGRLIIRGHSLDELAGHTTAEDMLALLFADAFDRTPTTADLGAARAKVFDRFWPRLTEFAGEPVYDAVRA